MTIDQRRRRESAIEQRQTASFSSAMIAMDQIIAKCDDVNETIDSMDPSDGIPITTTPDGESDSLVTAIDDVRAKIAAV